MDIENLKTVIAGWALGEPLVTKAYIFGSRARGDHRKKSAIGVAMEMKKAPGDKSVLATWIGEREGFRSRLQPLLPYTLNLEWYGGEEETPTIHKGLIDGSLVVYDSAI